MIETKIHNALSSLCNGQVYPLIADEKAESPYIVYTLVSDVRGDVLCGLAESRYTIQIDVYHHLYDDLIILKDNIISKLEILSIYKTNSITSYESETKLFRAMIEISIIR